MFQRFTITSLLITDRVILYESNMKMGKKFLKWNKNVWKWKNYDRRKGLLMSLGMSSQIAHAAEFCRAVLTWKWLFSSVGEEMILEVGLLSKAQRTIRTHVWLFARMCPHVNFQIIFKWSTEWALRTLIRSFPCVSTQMDHQIALGCSLVRALCTGEWFLHLLSSTAATGSVSAISVRVGKRVVVKLPQLGDWCQNLPESHVFTVTGPLILTIRSNL